MTSIDHVDETEVSETHVSNMIDCRADSQGWVLI